MPGFWTQPKTFQGLTQYLPQDGLIECEVIKLNCF